MNILPFIEEPFESELICIESGTYNIQLNKEAEKKVVDLYFIHDKFLEFYYPQQWDDTHIGARFYQKEYSEKDEYYLNVYATNTTIAKFVRDKLGYYLVIDSNYLDIITQDIKNLYNQISKILKYYKLNTDFNHINYKPISLNKYNTSIVNSRK